MVTSWKEGKMVFRRTEMAEIAQRLSRHFNVNIILQAKNNSITNILQPLRTETFEEIPATARKDCSYQVHNDRTETGQRLFLYPSDRYYRSKIKKLHFGVGDFLSPTSNSRNKQK